MKLTVYEGGAVRPEPSEKPVARDGYCVFRVKACGVCGSDLPRVFMGRSYYYPIVLGHEFAGVVEDSTNPSLVGMRACIFPILPCGECEYCKREQYANCTHYNYYGSRTDGGMQEYLLIKESNLIPIPDSVSFEAASMAEPMAVCLHAVKKAGIKKGDTVTVYGAGTIGLLCAMWAKHFGAEQVYLSDINESRLAFARELGFAVSADETPDAILDCSGAGSAVCSALERIKAFGTLVLVGNAERDVTLTVEAYSKLLRKQLTVCGSWNSDFRSDVNDWQESVDAMASGAMHPEVLITHTYPVERGDEAFAMIASGKEFFNKVTVVM